MDNMNMSQRMDTPPPVITTSFPVQQQVEITVGEGSLLTEGSLMREIDTKPEPQQTQATAPVDSKPVSLKKDKKREAIDGQAREIIFKVIKFFESEKRNRGYAYPVENVMKRASAATGLSESTIKRIKRDGLKAEATNTKMTGPKKKRVRRTKVQLDYYQLCALRGIVNGYTARKEVPTLSKILASAKIELNYRGGKESLRLILLNKLGIKFKKCEKKNKTIKTEEQNNMPPMHQQQPQQQQHQQQPPPVQNMMQMHHVPSSVHNSMIHPHMVQMKPPENHCVYGSVMPTLIGL